VYYGWLDRRQFLKIMTASTGIVSAAAQQRFACEQWDVFTKTALTGNPLAVFLDARGLSDAQMQAIARETNLSETTFVFPRDRKTEAEKGVRVRIFTREQELAFAGHPTLGTSRALLANRPGVKKIVLDLNAGPIPVTFDGEGYGEMQQQDAVVGAEPYSIAEIAPLLGLKPGDFDEAYPIRNVSTGRPNLMVVLRSLQAIRSIAVDWNATAKFFASGDRQRGFYLLTRETEAKSARVHARKPGRSGEDPATGSAAGAAAAYLVQTGIAKANERVLIEQGSEMQRPSEIYVTAEGLRNIRVGGYCAKVFEGSMTL
jgi:trans-2,3-dihydro-3-hydroxyanthranilate isomerase